MIYRISWHLIKKIGIPVLFSLLLLSLVLFTLSYTLADIYRNLTMGLLNPIVVVAFLVGWGVARAKPLPGWLVGLILAILGLEAVLVWVGQLHNLLALAAVQLAFVTRQMLLWPITYTLPDGTGLAATAVDLAQAVYVLLARLFPWTLSLLKGQRMADPIAEALFWGLLLWGVSGWAAWGACRHKNGFVIIAPAGLVMAALVAHHPAYALNLTPLLAATLLLMGLTTVTSQRRHWQRVGLDYASDIEFETAVNVVIITLILVSMAWAIPSINIRAIARQFQQSFASNQTQSGPAYQLTPALPSPFDNNNQVDTLPETVLAPGLPREHLLGSGPELSEQEVMLISTGNALPIYLQNGAAPRHYWRSLTYDRYTGRGWSTNKTERFNYKAGDLAVTVDMPGRELLSQRVQPVGFQNGILYADGEIVTANSNFSIDWRGPGDAFAASVKAESAYQVDSLAAVDITGANLRAATTDYPDWIRQRYLDVPASTPERVLELARNLTVTAPSPYDRAKTIEAYLRQFPYTLDLPAPPKHRDMADYFLFDLQQGYCDYYATSMVVLARAAGLPARLAVGYAGGTFDPNRNAYVVVEADAHSWAEVYFPDYGWIEFEPTAAQPVSGREGDSLLAASPPPLPPPASSFNWGQYAVLQPSKWWLVLPGSLLVMAAMAIIWLGIDSWRLRHAAPEAAIARLYRRLGRWAQRLNVPVVAGVTPHEFAGLLAHRFESRNCEGQKTGSSPAVAEIDRLTHFYVQTSYSNHLPDKTAQSEAVKAWRGLQKRLWMLWLRGKLNNLQGKKAG